MSGETESTSSPSKTHKYTARPEAQPVAWDALTDDQRKAAEQVCGILGHLAAQRWRAPEEKDRGVDLFLPHIDVERLNHVVLIDGERGSGKTAVLVTLLYAWSMKVRGGEPRVALPPEEVLGKKPRVVPIGLVDLQPLPESSNLLVDLVGQLVRVVEAIDSDRRGPRAPERSSRKHSPAPWQDMELEEPPVAKAWRDFLGAAAGWSANVKDRSVKLDLEAYALEVDQWRKRLDATTRCFRALGDALVEAYMEWRRLPEGEPPLFVVPIDDADMNPGRARELLDLVRTLWHPRIAFLMTGHSNLFREVLQKELEGKAPSSAADVAAAIYDKAIPPTHRAELKELSVPERFRIAEGALTTASAPPHRWLAIPNLKTYLQLQPTVANLLPGRLRPLRDLEQVLARKPPDGARALERFQGTSYPPPGPWEPSQSSFWHILSTGVGNIFFQYRFRLAKKMVGSEVSASDMIEWDHDGRFQSLNPHPNGYAGILVQAAPMLISPSVTVPWPLPDLNQPIEYALLSYLMNKACGLVGDGDSVRFKEHPDAGVFARWFIHVVLACGEAYRRARREAKPVAIADIETAITSLPAPPSWKELAEQCIEAEGSTERGTRTTDDPFAVWAFSRAGLLAAPESGLPAPEANDWLKALRDAAGARSSLIWEQCCRCMREERARRRNSFRGANSLDVFQSGSQNAAAFLHLLDTHAQGHLWFDEVESDPKTTENALVTALSHVQLLERAFPTLKGFVSYFLPDRLRRLRSARRETIKQWIEAAEFYGSTVGSAPLLMKAMFRHAAENEDAPADLRDINIDTTTLKQRMGPWSYTGDAPDTGTPIGPNLRVTPASYGWTPESNLRDKVLGALLEVAWDLAADAENQQDPVSPPPKTLVSGWWEAARGSFEWNQRTYFVPWPAVEWPALVDQLLLAEAWNEKLPTFTKAASLSNNTTHAADALASWFVHATMSTARWRNPQSPSVVFNMSSGEWTGVFTSVRNESNGFTSSRRTTAVKSWAERVALLAAPESGLSADAANGILDSFQGTSTNRPTLRELRRERLILSGIPEEEVDDALHSIDESRPEYKWKDRVAPDKSYRNPLTEPDPFDQSETSAPDPATDASSDPKTPENK